MTKNSAKATPCRTLAGFDMLRFPRFTAIGGKTREAQLRGA